MQLSSLRIATAVFFAALLILPFSNSASAQELPSPQPDLSENQLRAFAKVYVEVEKIRETYEPRLKEAKDAQEGQAIQKDAVGKMKEALSKEGLTEESYGQIFETARLDPALRQKLVSLINEEKK